MFARARRPALIDVIRIIERRQEAAAEAKVFELRVFRAHDGDVRACVVPVDTAITLDMMADAREHVAQSYLDALALCEMEGVAIFWVHDPLGLFPPSNRPMRDTGCAPETRVLRDHGTGAFSHGLRELERSRPLEKH